MKRIKTSHRGLTFSFTPSEHFAPGDKYDYTVYKDKVVISLRQEGRMTVSRKKFGNKFKSLVDIRSKKVRDKISTADYIEVEIYANEIVAHICKVIAKSSCKHIDISDAVQCREVETIAISKEILAAGSEDFVQLSLFENSENHYKDFGKPINTLFKIVSLFSGAGMLDYPFKQDSRYKIILANDIGKGQELSYQANIGDVIMRKDIRDLKIIPSADVVLGGPSCKPFSNCNRQKTRLQDHPDYFLIKEYIRIVKQADPKIFVIENVPEFITTADGMILDDIMSNLSEYSFSVKKIVDCDVGGYTTRKRVIIIGSKIGSIELDIPSSQTYKTVKDAFDKVDAFWYNYNDFSHSSDFTKEKMSFVQDGHNWQDVPEHMRSRSMFANFLRRLDPNKPSPAIVNVRKSCIMPPRKYLRGEERSLSVAECSALMGFPKEFKFLGSLDDRQQQVANGVPYMIAKLIKDSVTNALVRNNVVTT